MNPKKKGTEILTEPVVLAYQHKILFYFGKVLHSILFIITSKKLYI